MGSPRLRPQPTAERAPRHGDWDERLLEAGARFLHHGRFVRIEFTHGDSASGIWQTVLRNLPGGVSPVVRVTFQPPPATAVDANHSDDVLLEVASIVRDIATAQVDEPVAKMRRLLQKPKGPVPSASRFWIPALTGARVSEVVSDPRHRTWYPAINSLLPGTYICSLVCRLTESLEQVTHVFRPNAEESLLAILRRIAPRL
jgi:hypothetical protein